MQLNGPHAAEVSVPLKLNKLQHRPEIIMISLKMSVSVDMKAQSPSHDIQMSKYRQ